MLSRREFVAGAIGACLCTACGQVPPTAQIEPTPVATAPLSSFPRDGIYDQWVSQGFFIIRQGGRLYAPVAICTHAQATLVEVGGQLKCPRHGGAFNTTGQPVAGPPNRPLPRFGIRIEQDQVIVDRSMRFPQDLWSDPRSFLTAS